MRQKSGSHAPTSEKLVKDIRRATRKRHSAEEKIRIVMDGLRGEDSIAELKVLLRASITAGRRSSLGPAKNAWPEIRPARLLPRRSKNCDARPAS